MKNLGVVFIVQRSVVSVLMFLIARSFTLAQQPMYTLIAGDTLDSIERDSYQLFKALDGFQYAVFTKNADDSFDARIVVLMEDARKEIIVQKIRSIAELENRAAILYKGTVQDELKRVEEELNRTGADVTVTLKDSTSISGELLSVDDSITVFSESLGNHIVACENVQTVVVHGESKVGKASAIGAGFGAAVGGVLALTSAGDDGNRDEITRGFARGLRVVVIAGGAVAGFVVGFAVGLASSEADREFAELTPQNLLVLKSLARYPTSNRRKIEAVKR